MAAAEVAFLGTRLDQGFENHEEDGGRGDEGGGGADLLKKPRKRTAQGGGYRRGYLAGTANRMVTMLPIAMPDVIIDLDVGTLTKAVELESPAVQRNAACSLAHERWALSRRQQRRLRAAFEHETFVERMASSGTLTVAGLPGVVSGMAGGFLQLSALHLQGMALLARTTMETPQRLLRVMLPRKLPTKRPLIEAAHSAFRPRCLQHHQTIS